MESAVALVLANKHYHDKKRKKMLPENVLASYPINAHTGQYVNFESYTLWNHKISWIRSLVTRAK